MFTKHATVKKINRHKHAVGDKCWHYNLYTLSLCPHSAIWISDRMLRLLTNITTKRTKEGSQMHIFFLQMYCNYLLSLKEQFVDIYLYRVFRKWVWLFRLNLVCWIFWRHNRIDLPRCFPWANECFQITIVFCDLNSALIIVVDQRYFSTFKHNLNNASFLKILFNFNKNTDK